VNLDERDQALLDKAREVLDRQVRDLDPRTAARLQAARRAALEAAPQPGWVPWLAASGFAAAVVLLAMFWWKQPPPQAPVAMEELDLLASAEGLEFYDDLELYAWLADTDGGN
jgi:type VI protein secretion system component VasF